jgi:hypothetical protein
VIKIGFVSLFELKTGVLLSPRENGVKQNLEFGLDDQEK